MALRSLWQMGPWSHVCQSSWALIVAEAAQEQGLVARCRGCVRRLSSAHISGEVAAPRHARGRQRLGGTQLNGLSQTMTAKVHPSSKLEARVKSVLCFYATLIIICMPMPQGVLWETTSRVQRRQGRLGLPRSSELGVPRLRVSSISFARPTNAKNAAIRCAQQFCTGPRSWPGCRASRSHQHNCVRC
jgi:hypothetical protein